MAFVLNDRVKETSTTTGTGTFDLAGAETGFESFVSGVGDGNTTYYAISNDGTNEFEVGIGTVTDATTTYVSNKYQDLLLFGSLVEAYGYLKGPADMLQYYEGSYRRALQTYAVEQQGRRRRDEWQDGALRTPLKSESPSKY